MVSLGLVTHDHLEGKKKVLSWFLSSLFHSHSEWELQVQHISVFSVVFSYTKVLLGCLYSRSNWSLARLLFSLHGSKAVAYAAEIRRISVGKESACFDGRKEICDNVVAF